MGQTTATPGARDGFAAGTKRRRVFVTIGIIAVLAVVALGAVAGVGYSRYRARMVEADTAWRAIAARAVPAPARFDPATVAGLPEIAQRYFSHAIAPGTPLWTTVELGMEGLFLLGDGERPQRFSMTARQMLAPPSAFAWIPTFRSSLFRITGSDGFFDGHGWTRFWMFSVLPLVQAAGTEDIDRSAAARPALEAIWAPASLLPANGAVWQQTGPDTARVIFDSGAGVTIEMRLAMDGRVLEVWTMRWSDENPDKTFRLQPFGGTMEADASFDGFTIPSSVHVGNHFGTGAYWPFFQATITTANYR